MTALMNILRLLKRELQFYGALISGFFGPTLAGVTREIERAHFARNSTLRTYRYHRLKSAMCWIILHPLACTLTILAFYAAVAAIAWWQPFGGPAAPTNVTDYFRDFQSVNAAVLGAQATFIGIVFPLVIAFVGLLNQGRASFATRLTIFVDETAAYFVGGSSLILCAAIVVQMPLAGQLETRVVAAGTVLNILWFCINVIALGYFILKTVAYLHPAKRTLITKSYVANIAWQREFQDIVLQNRWLNASHYGYLPSGDEIGVIGEARGARVWYSPLFDDANAIVSRSFRRPVVLADVRFGLIAPVVRHWLTRMREGQGEQNLAFPLLPNTEYAKNPVIIARASSDPGGVSRWAIGAAVSFKRDRSDPAAIGDTARLLKEMIADLLALVDQRQADEFGAQLTLVNDFLAFLFAIAQSPSEDFNYARMVSGFSGVLGDEWAREFRDLQRRATERLADEPEFFGRCAYIASHTYNRCQDGITPVGLQSLFRIPNNLFHHLMKWSINELRAEGGTPPGAGGQFELKRREDAHATAWRHLVAGWERLFDEIGSPMRDAGQQWQDFARFAPNIREHLRLTAEMVGRAAWSGDRLAVNWSSDLLLNWITHAERNWDTDEGWWAYHREALTLEIIGSDWAAVSALPLMSVRELAPTPRAVFAGIIRNAWRDHTVALVSICAHWAIEFGTYGTAGLAAFSLLQNRRHDHGDAGVLDPGRMNARDVLTALLRIVGSGGRFSRESYAAIFEHLAEQLDGQREDPWVSMRIYSSHGGLGFSALYAEHALMIMAAGDEAQLDATLQRMLTQADDDTLRRREEYLKELSQTLHQAINQETHGLVFGTLIAAPALTFAERLESARRLVAAAENALAEHRQRAIESAPLDPARLNDVAVAAAARAFEPARFPLNLFGEIDRTNDALTAYTLRVGQQDKGAYTNPRMAHGISNEEDWWRDTMQQYVANVVWRDVLHAAAFETREGTTPETFWHAVRDAADALRAVGHQPLLVVASSLEPRWLYDWRYERAGTAPRPADLTINRDPNQPEGYEFSLNETPVFRGQTFHGEAYVIPKALLQRARFHRYENELCVSIRFEDDPANVWGGTLVAEFQHAVDLANVPAYRILYQVEKNTETDGEN